MYNYSVPTSMRTDLPCSSNSYSNLILLYLIPFLMRNPTPLLPLKAYSKLAPCHSYPLIVSSCLFFKCVSDNAITSGFSRSINCIILYFLLWLHLHWRVWFSCAVFLHLQQFAWLCERIHLDVFVFVESWAIF